MRRSWIMLPLSMALAVASAAHCRAPAEDEIEPTEDELTGVSNKLGLALVYDAPTRRVLVTLKDPLPAGDSLRVRVRRGDLRLDSEKRLACADLADAPVIVHDSPLGKPRYRGPEVDPRLLETLYDERWLTGTPTAQMLEALRRDGADSIVEACVMRGARVRARLQTRVSNARDRAEADAAAPLMASRAPVPASGARATARAAELVDRPIFGMESYAELCVAELGEIPFFKKRSDGSYDTFDCRDFTGSGGPIQGLEAAAIPLRLTASEGAIPATPTTCDERDVGAYNCASRCDKPAWLRGNCEAGPTVQAVKNERGAHWVLLCRGAQATGVETPALLERTKTFNDVAMIGHDPVSGKTCFFQNKIFQGNDGARIPHPADMEKSRSLWDEPKGHCTSCHAADAFLHSPWIDGAMRPNGTPIVPKLGVHADFEISWNGAPYGVVNRRAQSAAKVGGTRWEIPPHLVAPEADACATCHRVGGGAQAARLALWSVGEEGVIPGGPTRSRISDVHRTFARSHWMPPLLDGIAEANYPTSKYAQATARIRKCAVTPSAVGCETAPVPDAR